MNSKELFKALFQRREMPRVPFVPFICSFAAKLRQITVKEMFATSTTLANSLRDSYKLFGYDAILNVFDPSLEAEALGCGVKWESEEKPPEVVSHPLAEGKRIEDLDPEFEKKCRMPLVLEVTKRLTMVLGRDVGIIGVVTGPLTLGKQLQGDTFLEELKEDSPNSKKLLDFAGKSTLKVARLYCELKVDAILIIEELIGEVDSITVKKMILAFQPMWNVLRYFQIPSLLLAYGCNETQIEGVCNLGADAIILDGRPALSAKVKEVAHKRNLCFAGTIPTEVLLSEPNQVRESVTNSLKEGQAVKGFFLSNEWEMPYITPPQNVHEIMKAIKELETT